MASDPDRRDRSESYSDEPRERPALPVPRDRTSKGSIPWVVAGRCCRPDRWSSDSGSPAVRRCGAEPGHVHGRGQPRRICQGSVLQHSHKIAWYGRWLQPANGDILTPFGTDFRDYQKRHRGDDIDMPERRGFSGLASRGTPAGFPIVADRDDSLQDAWQLRQYFGLRVMQGRNQRAPPCKYSRAPTNGRRKMAASSSASRNAVRSAASKM